MKIIDVEAIWLRVPALDQPCEWGEDALIVRIHTDTGLIGVGETDSSPAVVKALIETPASHETCQGLRDILLGENPLEIDRLWKKMYRQSEYMGRRGAAIHAISALDIALWDLAGQHYGVPVHTLLGGKYREHIPAYGTFIPRPDEAGNRELVRGLLAQGLRSIKLGGAGFGEDLRKDQALLRVIREEIGEDVQLQIDLVGRWRNYPHALAQCDALREFDLNWIEEPLPSDDTRGLAYLAERSGMRISGGEGLATRHEFRHFLEASRPAIIQPDITRCGGISEMRHIYELAQLNGAQLVPHGFSTGILLAATVHFLAASEFGELIEYSQSDSPLFRGLVKNLLPLHDGQVPVPDTPGLGVVLDEAMIERYRVHR
ncbi:mandelate racemase/muconate lactonizing enzyme family protein [Pseudomonas sp. FSL R10-1350]|uniref:mandelate racemase/muconate lactonizing enzyme family protein n=1 Tax=Pseudomonas sp. FSL R10-1350 TaxID=2662197 RepID=UPI0012955829|nr:mandelate racemase/muconate lactonizing enzyme family protein [Pseudomonas sp. FSL R10-1350]MQU62580.1 mandelate racemase/muconate lactonizing enzyme family protein [Pseudomonas sp. FSL R10-1350]